MPRLHQFAKGPFEIEYSYRRESALQYLRSLLRHSTPWPGTHLLPKWRQGRLRATSYIAKQV